MPKILWKRGTSMAASVAARYGSLSPAAPGLRCIPPDYLEEGGSVIQKKVLWMAVVSGATTLAGVAVNRSLNGAWRLAMRQDPPDDPGSKSVEWRHAIIWTVATGVVVGLGRLFARRGAAAGWELVMGEGPPD
jgi:hypothetical protein